MGVILKASVQKDYLNRKMTHSLLLIAICDAQMVFTSVATGFPGSLHDQRALSMTKIGDEISAVPNYFFPNSKYHIVGDSAFQLRHNICLLYTSDAADE